MARADTRTLLPLDRWATMMGISPLHFNGVYTSVMSEAPFCGSVFPQYAWQDADAVSREDIAQAIRAAEDAICSVIGYPVAPDWITEEVRYYERPAAPELLAADFRNVRGLYRSLTSRWGQVISGGVKAKSVIQAGATINYSDEDGDGYDETATVAVATSVTDTNEIAVFFPGESGADEWEVRPLKKVTITGGNATILFRRDQVPDPDLWESLAISAIDGSDNANFLTTVDVYRVYNDPSTQGTLLWEPGVGCSCGGDGCGSCQFESQTACILTRNNRLGILTLQPATWNTETLLWDGGDFCAGRMADKAQLAYRAGWRGQTGRRFVDMDPTLAFWVAILACTFLDRPICGCDTVRAYIERWREDLAADTSRDGTAARYQVAPEHLRNPFGTTRGAVEVWRRVNQGDWIIGRSASS